MGSLEEPAKLPGCPGHTHPGVPWVLFLWMDSRVPSSPDCQGYLRLGNAREKYHQGPPCSQGPLRSQSQSREHAQHGGYTSQGDGGARLCDKAAPRSSGRQGNPITQGRGSLCPAPPKAVSAAVTPGLRAAPITTGAGVAALSSHRCWGRCLGHGACCERQNAEHFRVA